MAQMRVLQSVEKLCIHHSAGSRGSVEEFRAEHKAKGWADIGYHAVIGNGHGAEDGLVDPGRSERFEGAGVFGNNAGILHVCLVGNFDLTIPTEAQLTGLSRWILNRCRTYRPDGSVIPTMGHTELTIRGHGTACPGAWFTRSVNEVDKWRGTNRLGAVRVWLRERLSKQTAQSLPEWLNAQGLWVRAGGGQ